MNGIHTQASKAITAQTTGADVLAAPGATARYHVKRLAISGGLSDTAVISVKAGDDTLFGPFTPKYGLAVSLDFGEDGFRCALNTAITVVEATADVAVTVVAIADRAGG